MGLNMNDMVTFTVKSGITYNNGIPSQTGETTVDIMCEAQPESQSVYATSDGNKAVKSFTLFVGLHEDLDQLIKADSVTVNGNKWSILGYYRKKIGAHEIYVGAKNISN